MSASEGSERGSGELNWKDFRSHEKWKASWGISWRVAVVYSVAYVVLWFFDTTIGDFLLGIFDAIFIPLTWIS